LPTVFSVKQIFRRLLGWPRARRPVTPPVEAPGESFSLAAILDAFPAPVLLLDARRTVIEANQAAHEVFGMRLKDHDLAQSLRHPAALDAASAVLADARHISAQIAFQTPVARYYELHAMPVSPKQDTKIRAALVLLDVTAAHHVEQMRADFVANVSHELRSPLAALAGFIETLQGPAKNDVAARERFLAIMEGEAKRMARLIDDLLSLSRVEANEHVRPKGEVKIAELLATSKAALEPRAASRGMEIELLSPAELPSVTGDHDQLSEVFHNLLDNALKYGASGQAVKITAQTVERIPETGGKGVRICIRNMGEPIAPEHLPRLTERFYRIDKARSRDIGGTGLGLAIVKHIVSRHRGRLIIESNAENGTSFCIYLPEFRAEPALVI
jgi:two-component system phosphate regulon sensor histidine kinase PhoR